MRVVRVFIIAIVVVMGLGIYQRQSTQAKGPANRIIITSSQFDDDLVITDLDKIVPVSMANLEAFLAGEVEPPENTDIWYELERQYRTSHDFFTFDRVRYYPSVDGGEGYVHYLGIENGWSDYDGKWYRSTSVGTAGMRRLVEGLHLDPILLAVNSNGSLQLYDPETLDLLNTLMLPLDDWFYVSGLSATPDGKHIILNGLTTGDSRTTYVIDLEVQSLCDFGLRQYIMPTLQGDRLITVSRSQVELRDPATLALEHTVPLPILAQKDNPTLYANLNGSMAMGLVGQQFLIPFDAQDRVFGDVIALPEGAYRETFIGAWDVTFDQFHLTDGETLITWSAYNQALEVKTIHQPEQLQLLTENWVSLSSISAQNGNIFVYPRLGRYWKYDFRVEDQDDFRGGIYAIDSWSGDISFWQSDITFTHVIAAGDTFYALETPIESEITQLHQLDNENGNILQATDLPQGMTHLGYARLDPAYLEDFELEICASPLAFR